jgi:hypothetical protein
MGERIWRFADLSPIAFTNQSSRALPFSGLLDFRYRGIVRLDSVTMALLCFRAENQQRKTKRWLKRNIKNRCPRSRH